MGEIQKQSIYGTIYTYIGAIFGFITISVVFPRILAQDQIGMLSLIVSYSMILAQFSSLGFNSVTTRLFPYFKNDENKHNGFLFIAFVVSFIGFLLILIIFIFFRQQISSNKEFMENNYIYIITLTFFVLFFNAFDNYNKLLYNAVRGIFLKELFQKALTLFSALLLWLNIIDFHNFILFYLSSLCLPTIIMVLLLMKDKQFSLKPNLKFVQKDLALTMASVSLFGIITSIAGVLTTYIDKILIERLMGEEGLAYTGIYATCFFFGTVIILPSRALLKISSAFIADAWKKNDLSTIYSIYKKSAISQFIVGSLLVIGIWVNIDNIIIILTKDFEPGRYVILIIGIAFLTDMITGSSATIIGTSKYYRVQSILMGILIILIIVTNIIFIPLYGIIGSALATLLSKLIYNFIRFLYIWVKFKMQPYNYKYLLVAAISIFSYLVGYSIPTFDFFIFDIVVRSLVTAAIFILFIYLFNPSEDITRNIDSTISKAKKFLHLNNKR